MNEHENSDVKTANMLKMIISLILTIFCLMFSVLFSNAMLLQRQKTKAHDAWRWHW